MARQIGVLNDVQLRNWVKASGPVAKSDGGGLTFTLSANGAATWVLRYRIGGKQREMTLGRYPDMTLSKARELAAAKRVEVSQGVDVAAVKQQQKAALVAADTVAALCDEFFERTVKGKVKRPELVRAPLDNDVIRALGKMRIVDVKPIDVDRMITSIILRGSPVMANRVLSLTKTVFDYAIRRHWIEYNPAAAFTRKDAGGEEKARTRSLSDSEIHKLLKAVDDAGPVFRVYALAIRLLLLTAVRKAELIEAPWTEFDLEAGKWMLPKGRTKTDRDFTIPLPACGVEWLQEIKRITPTSPFVFPSRRRKKDASLSPETLNWVLKEIGHGLEHFTLHDLRRTARTHLAALGVAPHVAERCLNHKLPGINDIYDTHDYFDERQVALARWATKLLALEKSADFNVVALKRDAV